MTPHDAARAPRVLLIHPMSGDWEQMRSAPFLPLNLLHAATRVAAELPVEILDLRRAGDWRERLAAALRDPPLLAGITTMTGSMIASGLEIARLVRERAPSVPLVWGGMHPSLLPAETAAHEHVDLVVVADGEDVLLEVARRLAGGGSVRDLAGLPGTVCVRDGETVTGPAAVLPDLDELAEPPWGLVDLGAYLPVWDGGRMLSVESSRGCPRPCTFCYNTALDAARFRMLSAERTVARVVELRERQPFDTVYFVDDNFLLRPARAIAIGEGLGRLGVRWQIQGADIPSIARISDADLALLARSGLERISIGLESGSPRLRKRMRKSASLDRVRSEIERLGRHPIDLWCSFFVGTPTETIEDVRESVAFVLDLSARNPRFQPSPFWTYLPLPGTAMLADAVSEGHVPPADLEGWSHLTFDMESAASGITSTAGLSPAQAKALYLTSLFAHERPQFDLPSPVRALMKLYRPVARWRMRHLAFGLFAELAAYRVLHALWLMLASRKRERADGPVATPSSLPVPVAS